MVDVKDADCLVLAVAHDVFKEMNFEDIEKMYGDFENDKKIFIDIKSFLDKKELDEAGYSYWRL